MSLQEPQMPKPSPVTLDPYKSAVLVLDGSQRWGNPELPCHRLIPVVPRFLDRVRQAGLPIIYTVSFRNKGTPEGQVYTGLNRQPNEPVIYPDGFDKFTGGELLSYLNLFKPDTLVITGYRSNISVLHTATRAARELNYTVVIPIDGIVAKTDYEQAYTLFHFTVLPVQASDRFRFTKLDMILFAEADI